MSKPGSSASAGGGKAADKPGSSASAGGGKAADLPSAASVADLPDINDFSEEKIQELSACVLRALCVAHGAPSSCTQEHTAKEVSVLYLKNHILGRNLPWSPRLAAFKQMQRVSFEGFFDRQNAVHR